MPAIQDALSRNLEAALDRRMERQQLLASNLANLDTPGYQPVDLDFDGALREAARRDPAIAGALARTDRQHMAADEPRDISAAAVIVRPDHTDGLDGNGVDLDREMARFTDNAARFKATAEAVRRRYALLTYVIMQARG